MHARSYYKRTLDTTSRFKYIENAYDNMKKWMCRGTDDEKKKKRYIHRHLALPPGIEHGDEEKEILMEFAYQYVRALLTYCSDDLKPGMCFPCVVLACYVHSLFVALQDITSCPSARRASLKESPSEKLRAFTFTQSTLSLRVQIVSGKHGNPVAICPK